MKKTLEVLNAMQAAGVIERYALTGAMAALHYMEPAFTEDLDVLVTFSPAEEVPSGLLALSPIAGHLDALGYREWRKEGIVVEGWPVQFLPVADGLDAEALARAEEVEMDLAEGAVAARVLRAEHLVAIALRTGRPKDSTRIVQLLDGGRVDEAALDSLLARHGMTEKWEAFSRRHGLGGGMTL